MSNILALVDGSVYTQSVCDHAAWVATRSDLPVTLVHVLDRRAMSAAAPDFSSHLDAGTRERLLADLAAHDEQASRFAQQRARVFLDAAKARLEQGGVADVSIRLRQGDLVETLAELEPVTDLLVVGKRGEAADFARMHLGSNLERIARASPRPVLVASRGFKPIARVLVAFDGGPSVMKAVVHIAATKLLAGLEIRLLAVGAPSSAAELRLVEATARLRGAGYDAASHTLPGQPDEVIAGIVQDGGADLLVMGAYGHSRIRTLFIGSTTTEMIRSCLVPVLLFR